MAYRGPSGRMGGPDNPERFTRLDVDDLKVYVARDIWDELKPRQTKLLVAVSGYGRFWIYLETAAAEEEQQLADRGL